MFLQDKQSGVLVEILDLDALFDPMETSVPGQVQAGQEEQEPLPTSKDNLVFPSGEALPRCWLDVHYRDEMAEMPQN